MSCSVLFWNDLLDVGYEMRPYTWLAIRFCEGTRYSHPQSEIIDTLCTQNFVDNTSFVYRQFGVTTEFRLSSVLPAALLGVMCLPVWTCTLKGIFVAVAPPPPKKNPHGLGGQRGVGGPEATLWRNWSSILQIFLPFILICLFLLQLHAF
jgi:hypothetical protein